MRKFAVIIRGDNVLISKDGEPTRLGFFVTRFVEAPGPTEAESDAISRVRQELSGFSLNDEADPPALYLDKMEELVSFKGCKLPGTGYIWLAEDSELNTGDQSNSEEGVIIRRVDHTREGLKTNSTKTAGCFSAYLILAFVLLPFSAGGSTKRSDPPPNIVLILADDLGWGDVGFNGRKEWKTPNLDRLARQGTVFKRFYAAGTTCGPSRAALMTGRYGIHNGVTANNDDLPDKEITIAQALRERGYATGLFGKWHHGKPRPGRSTYRHPMDLGFDEFFGFTDATAAHQKYPKTLWFGREEKPVSGYSEELFTDHAVDFLHRNRDKRFFLYLPYTNPHFRIEVPKEDLEPYLGKFPEKDTSKPFNATYAAMIANLDRQVGRVLKTLDELKLSRNTLVIFTSDQGATFETGNMGTSAFHDSNRPFRGQKRTLYEGGIRVPAVVRWPGHVPGGRVANAVYHFVDIFPTLLTIAGGSLAGRNLDGVDLMEVWEVATTPPNRTLLWEWRTEGTHQTAAMRGEMKLILTGSEPPELFDVVKDPAERRNIAAEKPEIAQRLQKEIKEWLATESEEARLGKSP